MIAMDLEVIRDMSDNGRPMKLSRLCGALGAEDGQMLLVVVALTMVFTPFLGRLGQIVSDRIERLEAVRVEDLPEDAEPLSGHVVIAGYGRVGQAVAARLEAAGVSYIAVDLDPHRIAQARHRGLPVFFGDATRPEILDALYLGSARSMVVTVDSAEAALQLVAMVCYIFPDLAVYARARQRARARTGGTGRPCRGAGAGRDRIPTRRFDPRRRRGRDRRRAGGLAVCSVQPARAGAVPRSWNLH